jgi:hypothetical protein
MNKTNEIIGHFEKLPNEILLYLFENYIRLIDIYIAFSRLNHHRINEILNCCRFSIDIPRKDIFHLKSVSYYANQIVSLHISTFSNDLDLSKLINLRSLHIEKPTRSQLLSIHGECLPNLSYLSLSPCWFSVDELPKHLTNLAELCSFKNLRFCILPNGKIFRVQEK